MINSLTTKLSSYETNRLEKIHLLANKVTWCHIPGQNNVGDGYSRGIFPSELISNRIYLEGPPNLKSSDPLYVRVKQKDSDKKTCLPITVCPPLTFPSLATLLVAMRDIQYPRVSQCPKICYWKDLIEISRLSQILPICTKTELQVKLSKNKVLVIDTSQDDKILNTLIDDVKIQPWDKFVKAVKNLLNLGETDIVVGEQKISPYEYAKLRIFGAIQRKKWSKLFAGLNNRNKFRCPPDLKGDFNQILQVNPHFDPNTKLLVCFGRYATIEGDFASHDRITKIMLPDKNLVVKKLILDYHEEFCHVGAVALSGIMDKEFWLIRAKQAITNVTSNCLVCRAQKANSKNPEMSIIPKVRLQAFDFIFKNIGIDVMGPFKIKYKEGRNVKRKCFVLALTCLNTRALILHLLRDMTAESLIMAIEIENNRRNRPIRNIYSDQGSNMIGASNVLSKELSQELQNIQVLIKDKVDMKQLEVMCKNKKMNFHFGKARTPHNQGFVERLIGLTKILLNRVVGPFSEYKYIEDLDQFSFDHILQKVAFVINQRPISPISATNSDIDFIRPGDFMQIPIKGRDTMLDTDFQTYLTESRKISND